MASTPTSATPSKSPKGQGTPLPSGIAPRYAARATQSSLTGSSYDPFVPGHSAPVQETLQGANGQLLPRQLVPAVQVCMGVHKGSHHLAAGRAVG